MWSRLCASVSHSAVPFVILCLPLITAGIQLTILTVNCALSSFEQNVMGIRTSIVILLCKETTQQTRKAFLNATTLLNSQYEGRVITNGSPFTHGSLIHQRNTMDEI
jgi:hypothetical protein